MRASVCVLLAIALYVSAYDWTPVEDVLNHQIEIGAFPGCVAMVATKVLLAQRVPVDSSRIGRGPNHLVISHMETLHL